MAQKNFSVGKNNIHEEPTTSSHLKSPTGMNITTRDFFPLPEELSCKEKLPNGR